MELKSEEKKSVVSVEDIRIKKEAGYDMRKKGRLVLKPENIPIWNSKYVNNVTDNNSDSEF